MADLVERAQELLGGGNGSSGRRIAALEARIAALEAAGAPAGDTIASPATVVSLTAKLIAEIEARTWEKLVAHLLETSLAAGSELKVLGGGTKAEVETLKATLIEALKLTGVELLEVIGRLQAFRFNTKPYEAPELTESPLSLTLPGGIGSEVWLKSNKEIEVTGVTLGTPVVIGGDQLTLYNMRTNAFNIVLANESGAETVTKRFRIKGGNFTLEPGMAAKFTYRQSRFVLDTRS